MDEMSKRVALKVTSGPRPDKHCVIVPSSRRRLPDTASRVPTQSYGTQYGLDAEDLSYLRRGKNTAHEENVPKDLQGKTPP